MDAGAITVRILADTTALTAGLTKASGSVASFGRRMSSVGAGMTKYMTLPIVAAGAVAVKMASDFESSMRLIQTQAGGSAKDVKLLSASVLELGMHAEHGPMALSQALYHLKSVGMGNADAMNALKIAEEGANVGGADLEQTTNALAGAWRVGIKGAGSFEHTMGVLNATVGAGNLRMEDLNSALGTGILTSAKTFGVSLQSVGAGLALLTSQGQPATQSATRLRMAISLMGAPTDKAAKALSAIDISSTDLAKALRSGGLVGAIGLLKEHMQGLSKIKQSQLLATAFGGSRSGGTIMALVQGYDTLIAKQKQIVGESGKFGSAVAAQQATTAAKWHHFIAVIETDAIKFGNVLLPMASGLGEKLGSVGEALGNMSSGARSFIVYAGLAVAAAGPLTFMLGKFLTMGVTAAAGVMRLVGAIDVLQVGLRVTAAGGGIGAFGEALMSTLGPAGIVVGAVAGVAALTYGVVRLGMHLSGFDKKMALMQNAAKATAQSADLRKWADQSLGGHLVSTAGSVVWKPAVTMQTDKNDAVVQWIKSEAAKEHAARAEALAQQKADQALAAQAYFQQRADMLLASAQTMGHGAVEKTLGGDAYKADIANAQHYGQVAAQLQGKLQALTGKDWRIRLGAHDADLTNAIHQKKQQLEALQKKKYSPEIAARTRKIESQLKKLEAARNAFRAKHWEGLADLRIEKVKARLADINKSLDQARADAKKGVNVGATITQLLQKKAQASAQLKALHAQKTSPTVAITDHATGPVNSLKSLIGSLQDKTVTITTVMNTVKRGPNQAQGSSQTVSSPTLFLAGESGRETVTFRPYGKGAADSTSGGSSGGGGGGPTNLTANLYLDGELMHAIAAEVVADADTSDSAYFSARGRRAGY